MNDQPAAAEPRGHQRPARRIDTRNPRRSRTRAVKILYQADVRGIASEELLERLERDPVALEFLDDADGDGAMPAPERGIDGFTRSLVLGVVEHRSHIDEIIGEYARRWQIRRMPIVDRTVLRLATYELLYESTPPAVVIHEAVEVVKALSTDDSGAYVNGVLDAIRRHGPHLEDDATAQGRVEAAGNAEASADTKASNDDPSPDDTTVSSDAEAPGETDA